jgi:peptidoglycan L-alanyl-D-glutamate endopeptidase CwlK
VREKQMNNITTVCRDLSELNPLVRIMLELAVADIKSQGVNPLITETYRSQERQNYLYCQGRTISEAVAKGINSAFAQAYCNPTAKKVTWTLNSIHKERKAVDVVPQRDGKAIWNVKDKHSQIIIGTMQKYGFEAGANWTTSPDSPHFQVKGDFSDVFNQYNNTVYITKVIQHIFSSKMGLKLVVDGAWGGKTTDAINAWRKSMKWTENGSIGVVALKELLV